MRVVVFGAAGQLGADLMRALDGLTAIAVGHDRADIADADAVDDVLRAEKPDWVVNAASMTHVDRCETDVTEAFVANAVGARTVAVAAAAQKARLVHISTDYVFDGRRSAPYIESDPVRPISVYGASKAAGEFLVETCHAQAVIARTSGLYGTSPCRGKGGANFVDTMLRLAGERDTLRVVSDEVLTPTFTEDLAAQLRAMIDADVPAGTYHVTQSGECSWYDFAKEIFRIAGVDVKVEETTAAEWGAPAKRPAYSVLENRALAKLGLDRMAEWNDALGRYLATRKH